MLTYIFRRLLSSLFLLLGILTVTFILLHVAPGNPVSQYAIPGVSPETLLRLQDQFGLNDPLPVRFWKWISSFLRFDFGVSIAYHRSVISLLVETASNTLWLTVPALGLQYCIGIFMGVLMAVRNRTLVERTLSILNMVLYSLPGFWLALMCVLIFSLSLGWFPPSNMQSAGYEALPFLLRIADRIHHLILPVAVLGIASAAATARYVRGSMLDVLQQPFIVTAQAKGLSNFQVLIRHALRNTLIPIITLGFLSVPALLSGAVVIEWIFALPGMGRLTVEAIYARDYPVIMASTFIASLLVLLSNFGADLLYTIADPRVQLTQKHK